MLRGNGAPGFEAVLELGNGGGPGRLGTTARIPDDAPPCAPTGADTGAGGRAEAAMGAEEAEKDELQPTPDPVTRAPRTSIMYSSLRRQFPSASPKSRRQRLRASVTADFFAFSTAWCFVGMFSECPNPTSSWNEPSLSVTRTCADTPIE